MGIIFFLMLYLFIFSGTLFGLNDYSHRWIRISLAIMWPALIIVFMCVFALIIVASPLYWTYQAILGEKWSDE